MDEGDVHRLGGAQHPDIVTCKPHRVPTASKELQGRQVQGIEGPNGDGELLDGSCEHGRRQLQQ